MSKETIYCPRCDMPFDIDGEGNCPNCGEFVESEADDGE